MQVQHRNKRKLFVLGILFLMLLFCTTAQADAAGWKKNVNGTYSYYNNKGKKVKSQWIKGTYYVNSKGVRQTGWLFKNNNWYYFQKNGKVVKNKWIKAGSKKYYAGKTGALYLNGIYKIGNARYAFDKRGTQLTGKQTIKGKTYFFGVKKGGRMLFNSWCKSGGRYYYFGKDGTMAVNCWIGRYHVTASGNRLTKSWKNNRYLGSNGKAVTGLQKINGNYYYFDPDTWYKVTNKTMTIDQVTYVFNGSGVGSISDNGDIPMASVAVEKEYYTDPAVDNEILLAAIIYREAGNQSYAGKTAVGLVVMNRVLSAQFPSTIREVVYQKGQFTPANKAAFTKLLNTPSSIPSECKQAAKELLSKFTQYKQGQKVMLKIDGKDTPFPYLFFMTPAAYQQLGLRAEYLKLGGHVFFEKWI